jgi:hypothetical protein
MPIKFRCTVCRARLHVPGRWSGTSVVCPKCTTRVVIPATGEQPATRFEQSDVERSLLALQPSPGGIFADKLFEIPLPLNAPNAAMITRSGIALPHWMSYAFIVFFFAIVAIGSFFLGAWWNTPGAQP